MVKNRYLYFFYFKYLLLIFNTLLYAQSLNNITGTINNFDGDPISGAIITSLEENTSDTSNASGSFEIITSPIIHYIDPVNHISQFEIKHNCIYFSLDSRENVHIELFNIRGRKLQTVFHGILGRGNYRIPFSIRNTSCQVYVVGVRFGTSFVLKKSINLKKNGTLQNLESQTTQKQKNRAENPYHQNNVLDTLVVTHAEYINKQVWLYNYTDPVETILWDKELRITDEVGGWTDQPEHFATFDTAQLYDLIDGGAPIYNEQGLVDGIYQFLKKDDGKDCAISFYNFGIPENSLAMFTEQSSWISSQVIIPGYDTLQAVGDEVIGGATIYVHFNQFNLELTFGGYSDIELLKNDVVLFLEVYESKIGKIYLSL